MKVTTYVASKLADIILMKNSACLCCNW